MTDDIAQHASTSHRGIPRVCMLTETFHPVLGGSENHAFLLAQSLNALGMPTRVLTRRCERLSARDEVVDGVHVRRIPPTGMGRWGKFAMIPGVCRTLARMRDDFDLLYVCAFRILGTPALIMSQRLGKACVLRAETLGEMSGAYASVYRTLPAIEAMALRRWIRYGNRLLPNADAFVAISQLIAEEYAACGVVSGRIHHIPNGVDSHAFCPVSDDARLRLREALRLPGDSRIVTYTGRLVQGKGLEYLLQAWEKIISLQPDAHLVLVGSGHGEPTSIEGELRRRVQDTDLKRNVIFAGWSDKAHEYVQASDIYVFPSEHEGLPLAPLEAMSCGLPVIASSVGGIPDAIRHGENGILVEPRDVAGLVREISQLLDHPDVARRLGANASETVRERYSIGAVASRHYELFCSTWEKRHTG